MSKKQSKKPNKTYIGGQAVFEGVMMRGKTAMATSVRDEDGIIRVETKRLEPPEKKKAILRAPIIRGMINFFASMVMGVKTLMRSTEVFGGDEPTKFDKWLSDKFKVDVMTVITYLGVALGLGLSVFLFILSPQWLTSFISKFAKLEETSFAFSLIEGAIRIVIFILYILATSISKDLRRTYKYHGAEHKTISCYESGKPLTIENVRASSRVHDRCGTTFMFFVMFISILVFSLTNWVFGLFDVKLIGILRALIKIALLPLVAGLSYELLKGLAKTDLWLFYPLKLPGLLLQRITTSEPDDDMIEVAITSFNKVLEMDADPTIEAKDFVTAKRIKDLLVDIKDILAKGGVDEVSDAEWIVSICCKIKRSEIDNNLKYVAPKTVEYAYLIANKRASGMPLWYIFGNTDFYGITLKVNENVLIPRPETEELVAYAVRNLNEESLVLDLCTGSGAIAIAIKKETNCIVEACDISEKALLVAKENDKDNNTNIKFIQSDLFEKIDKKYNMIVSNPPYIPKNEIEGLQREVKFEPIIALDGGDDGLDFYRKICAQAHKHLFNGGLLIMECGEGQAKAISEMLLEFKNIEIIKDINGIERIIKAEY